MTMLKRTTLNLMIAALCLAIVPASAMAQSDADDAAAGNALSSTTTTVLGVTTLAVGLPFLITSTTGNAAAKSTPKRRRRRRVRRRVSQNTQAFQQSLAMGGGEILKDIATIYEVPTQNVATFSKSMRTHRAEILKVWSPSQATPMTDAQVAALDTLFLTFVPAT